MTVTHIEDKFSKSERLRNLEILKYGPTVRIFHDEDIPAADDATPPRLADDAILTALCQLVALRLDCRNGFMCLVDPERQHVIAEATRSVSPYEATKHGPGDGLMFGVRSFDRYFGFSGVTFPTYTQGPQCYVDNRYTSANGERCIFLNLMQEPLVTGAPFLQGKDVPHRFYVEVPMKNSAGIVIGNLCVLDDRPRQSFDEVDVQPMLDAAKMAMEHLELVRLKDINAHAERLLQGLSHFNAGQASINQWVKDHPTRINSSGRTGSEYLSNGSRSLTDKTITDRSTNSLTQSMASPSTQPEQYFSTGPMSTENESSTIDASDQDMRLRRRHASLRREETNSTTSTVTQSCDTAVATHTAIKVPQRQAKSRIQEIFARAANLIRESMDLEAACFVEMPSDSRFSIDTRRERQKRIRFSQENTTIVKTSDASTVSVSESDSKYSSSDARHISNGDENSDPTLCECTALSMTETEGDTSSVQIRIPEKALGALISAHPFGHVFHFDAHGLLSSGDDQDSGKEQTGPRSRRRRVAQILSTSFPRARSLLFVPFYSGEHQKMYSAFFGWIEDPFRILTENDRTYVSGFAHSVMCEVLRLETLMVEKAKSVFMSSISHELRSPLHGILAATELLRESNLTVEQNEFALMTDSCGRTLLDIVNNLLEHAKINNNVDDSGRKKKGKSRRKAKTQVSSATILPAGGPSAVVSLVEVIEETIASVVSGHAIRSQRAEQVSIRRRRLADTVKDAKDSEMEEARPPMVVLNVQNIDNWYVHTDPGAWRRIVMNLVGNALKYTNTGHVVAGLHITKSTTKSGSQTHRIVFTVSDSGQGMSESYMKSSLYTPFVQEDQLSVGVGLGLSIVHRLVTDLSGEIKIDSEMEVGTNVRVTAPTPPAAQPQEIHTDTTDGSIVLARAMLTGNNTVCFFGFDLLPSLDTVPTGMMSSLALGLMKLKQSLIQLFNDWFGIDTTLDAQAATICVVEASHARTVLDQDPSNVIFTKRYIVVSAYDEVKAGDVGFPGSYNAIATPIGPMKLARILHQAMQPKRGRPHEFLLRHKSLPYDAPALRGRTTPTQYSFRDGSPVTRKPVTPPPDHALSRILLVDDNDINVRILAGLIRKLRNPYTTASNGKEALEQFIAAYEQNQPFQYVFMDISMPIMDGLTSTRRIREYERSKRKHQPAQIFALTGLGHENAQDEAIASGVDQYFRKPVRLDILRRVIMEPGHEPKK